MLNLYVGVQRVGGNLASAVEHALLGAGILDHITPGTRVSLKPNFTYPYHKPGVTTSPAVLQETVRVLRQFTSRISIVETDGGYGAWKVKDAFTGHGVFDLVKQFGVEAVNLCDEDRELINFKCRGFVQHVPLPKRLLHETDLFITMPVPKIHCMTGLTLSYKNQWGCIPDIMRLRRHYVFNDAIVAINRALKPVVLADGTYFLDRNGPMDGDPVQMDLILAATSTGAFDRYVSELMGFPWQRVAHLRRAVALGDMPADIQAVQSPHPPAEFRTRVFRLERTLQNYVALSAFKSRFVTWFGYESWFGRVVVHSILYALVGKPVKPKPAAAPGSR
jgi:uncharacterized protein (DUF362 family)